MKPPPGEPWIWKTRELIASDAYQSLGINARRFIDFLLIDHMNHAGTENGNLKATHKQLVAFGVGARYVAAAIREAEEAGLIDCRRGGMRVANVFRLTWLPDRDGDPPTNRWRKFKIQKSALQREGSKHSQGKADTANLPYKGKAVLTLQREGPSISRTGSGGEAASFGPSFSVSRPPHLRVVSASSSCPRVDDPRQIDIEEAVARAAGRQP